MANYKINYAIEIVWLIISIMSLVAGIHKTYITEFKESYPFFIITLLSIFIYSLRRYFRLSAKNKTPEKDLKN